MRIIYEDNHLLVVEKPPGVLSQKDKTGDEDISFLLKKHLKEKYKKPGNVYLGHVHRLDRSVGGVMVFAKTSKAASRLSEQMREGRFQKKYMAVCAKHFHEKQGTLIHYLKKDKKTNTVKASPVPVNGFKKAVLDYRVLKENKDISLVEVKLHTGRSHQIRVQFKESGHAVIGDAKYGDKKSSPGIALWSYSLQFDHPTKRTKESFICTPPAVFPWSEFKKVESSK
ncbi:MAG: RNA pseudouridine synthase [Candidatus Aureabacteria bacterium]|nr:RNA pseudouridine synthase [Candidatus Auribacterota bacterium]